MTKPTFSCELTPYSLSTLRIVTSLLSLSLDVSLESPVSFFLCLVKVVVDVVTVSVVAFVVVVVVLVVVVVVDVDVVEVVEAVMPRLPDGKI